MNSDIIPLSVEPHETCICFWPVLAKKHIPENLLNPDFMWLKLSAQCDTEDQCYIPSYQSVVGVPDIVPDYVSLFAPVQFSNRYDPLPLFINQIGKPDKINISEKKRELVALWQSPLIKAQEDNFIDGNAPHPLRQRVKQLCEFAVNSNCNLLLTVIVGYSYSMRNISAISQKTLQQYGFYCTTRYESRISWFKSLFGPK
jgi:hypothetical protein